MITSYISLVISAFALFIGIYNWSQSLVKFKSETTIEEALHGCWCLGCTITNYSSRPVSAIDIFVTSGGSRSVHIVPTPIRTGEVLYKLDGIAVAKAPSSTSFPLSFSPYESKYMNIVLTKKPDNRTSYLVVKTARKEHRMKISFE